jgi:hypothetical protein
MTKHDEDFISKISPDVLRVLVNKGFFEMLDDQIYPIGSEHGCVSCSGKYAASTTILTQLGFDEDAIAEITQVLASRGGVCDCEILFNVAEESRL